MGFAGGAFNVFVFKPFGFVANEAPKALGIAVVFAAFDDRIDHLAGHETIIAGAINHFGFTEAVDEFVKTASEKAADRRLTFAGNTASGNTIVAVLDKMDHFWEEAGRILKVGVHHCDEVTLGIFETSEHDSFFAKITRKSEIFDAGIRICERFDDF